MSEENDGMVPKAALTKEREKRQALEAQLEQLNVQLEQLKPFEQKAKEYDVLKNKLDGLENEFTQFKGRKELESTMLKLGVLDDDVHELARIKFEKSGEKDFNAWVQAQVESKPTWMGIQQPNASQQAPQDSLPTSHTQTAPQAALPNLQPAAHVRNQSPPPAQPSTAALGATRSDYAQNRDLILQNLGFK